jgi:zinc protease
MILKTTWKAALAAVMVSALVLPAAGADAAAGLRAWPQSSTDIAGDKNVRFGILPNGMRYAIQHNATPPGQGSLRLRYDAGSMEEIDAQQGLAHFLEHMSFDGSRKVPNGEMVKILQRHGLAFGADTNASTSWDETIYQLDLPNADDDTIDTSLMLLREGASELLLAPDAILKESGVVLSEERARDTPGLHVYKAGIQFFLKGQLASRRLPIGQVDIIKSATHEQIADYYAHYYRPERATLVAVGDFDVDAMEAKIKAKFSDWRPQGPAGPEPDVGQVAPRRAETQLLIEPGAPLSIQMRWTSPPDLSKDSVAKRQRKLIEGVGLAVLNRRLQRLSRSPSPPFISAQAYKGDEFHSAEVTALQVSAQPDAWKAALTAADQQQRQLVKYGVRQDELDREIAEWRVQLQTAAAQEPTRRTPQVANDIVQTIDDDEVYTSPTQDLVLFEDAVKGLKAETVNKILPQVFGGQGPLVFMSSPKPVDGGEATLASTYAQVHASAVEAPTREAAKAWPYASFGKPGEVAEQKTLDDLGTTLVRFRNGVRLTVKPTKFRQDQVLVRVRLGHGQLDLPKDRATTGWAAHGAFIEGGLKDLSTEEMEQILASNIYGAEFSTSDDAFVLQGATRPEDLGVQLQVLAAYATKPGFRPEAFQRVRTYTSTLIDQLDATPSGVMSRDLSRLMHGGDLRYGFPSRGEVASAKPEDLKALLQPVLASGPIDVTVVGDIPLEKAIALTASTFGALPSRQDVSPAAQARAVSLPQPTPEPLVLTHKGRADQAIAYAAWPTDGFYASPQMARTLRVLADVIENRLVDDLRLAAGETYSPQAGAEASLVYPKYGFLSAEVEIPPQHLGDFYADLAKISASLRASDVTPDELDRAKKPLIESLLKSRATNGYWLEQLADVQDNPRKLDAIRSVVQSLQSVDAAQLHQAAQLYLQDSKVWKLEIEPQSAAQAGGAAVASAAASH